MSQGDTDSRRQSRLLTEEDLRLLRNLIEQIVGTGEGGRPAVLLRDMTFPEARGGIPAGTTFPMGTPHDDILERLARKPVVPASYIKPELYLTCPLPDQPEIGSMLHLSFTPVWIPNDAGMPIKYTLTKEGHALITSTTPDVYTEPEFRLTGLPIRYQASVDYDTGPIKNDSEGKASPTGRIPAGSIKSNAFTVSGLRYGFYGADTIPRIPERSKEIRELECSFPVVGEGITLTLRVRPGSRRATIWFPNTLPDLSSIRYREQGNAEYIDRFEKTSCLVEGVDGYASTPYKGYTWVFAVAPESAMTMEVRLEFQGS